MVINVDYNVHIDNRKATKNRRNKTMMKHEFERMAGREVTTEQYDAFETLYMNSNLNQQDFVKSIKQILKAIPQPKKRKISKECA